MGHFFRLSSPFQGNITAWMVVSEDKKQAIVAIYKVLNDVNCEFRRMRLHDSGTECYIISGKTVRTRGAHYGAELMRAGLVSSDASASEVQVKDNPGDFYSRIFILEAE